MVEFHLDINGATRAIDRYWELCVGSCHAATALREDYRAQLRECRRELGFRYVRFHGLFDDDMSVVKRPLFGGAPVLSFTNVDSIFDFLLDIGIKPFVELGFMPSCLASGSSTIFHYKANTSKPADYAQWEWLVRSFIEHVIGRYGRDEVRQWFFEVWNEPNLGAGVGGSGFWAGTMEEYYELYAHSAAAVKTVDPMLQVGGPATSNNAHIRDFVAYCHSHQVPVDFISTHHYPADVVCGDGVQGGPDFVRRYFALDPDDKPGLVKLAGEYAAFREHLWEKVERGALTAMARRAVAEAGTLPVYYTEWSSLAGLQSDGPFGASFIAKTVLDNMGLVQGYAYWTFSDIFEESGMPSAAFHGGYGLMTLQGIKKAPYRAFQLLHMLGNEQYAATMANGTVDVYALYKREAHAVQLLMVNHQSLQHPISDETVSVELAGLGDVQALDVEIYRVDGEHANALAEWERLGRLEYVTECQIERLKAASALVRETGSLAVRSGSATVRLELPRMGTALVNVYLTQERGA